METKDQIRTQMRNMRRAVPQDEHSGYSQSLCEALLARADVCEAIAKRKPFAVYLASRDEIDLSFLINALWEADVTVAVPCWDAQSKSYLLGAYDNTSALVEGLHRIPEPAEVNHVAPQDVGVWIVPGLAFTEGGERLGYGGGWYDRLLSCASPDAVILGVAYPFQLLDSLPVEPHDRKLTSIVHA